MPARRNPNITPEMRKERWRRCAVYLRKGGNVPAAIKLARRDNFQQATSVWISALGKMWKGEI